jgi:phosphate starvation-inducible protein PhoH
MAPIMESFTDNIRKIIGRTRMEKLMELGVIEIVPIAFARGRSIDNSIILLMKLKTYRWIILEH